MQDYYSPVFIGGCGRSGTTMLGDMLGATDITFSTPESPFFHEFLFGVFLNKYPDNKSAVKWLINNSDHAVSLSVLISNDKNLVKYRNFKCFS